MYIIKLYDNISKKQFKYHLISLCFFGDLLVAHYLYRRFTDPEALKKMLKQMKHKNIDFNNLPPDYFQQILYIMNNTLICMLGAMMIFHMAIYLFYHKNKVSSILYLKTLTWAGCIGSLWMGFASPDNWQFFIQGPLYLYGALGLKKFN